jgi:hypothetical protein
MDSNALYVIHIDNYGDGAEDLSFQFRITNRLAARGDGMSLPIGGKNVAIALIQAGGVSNVRSVRDGKLNHAESFTVTLVRGDRRAGSATAVTMAGSGATYAGKHVHTVMLPALLELALGLPGMAPTNFPRTDLVTTFLTGIARVNQPRCVVASERLRLNTAIAPVPCAMQNRLGKVGNIVARGSDDAGFPNGRRPKDDVVDQAVLPLLQGFPYPNTPVPGSR